MAIVGPLYKLVFGGPMGPLASSVESWSCSIHVGAGADGSVTPGNLDGALTQWIERAGSYVNGAAWLSYWKFNQVDPATGRYVSAGLPLTHFLSSPVASGMPTAPFQLALALSWVTGATRGYASKGRIFAPFTPRDSGSSIIGPDGTILDMYLTGIANSAAQLITDINGSLTGSCVVYSQRGLVENEILAAKVGSVPDTQRRRRRSLVEVYDQVPVA